MNFVLKLFHGIAFVPGAVHAIESLFGAKNGSQKKDAALSFVETALNVADAVAGHDIADAEKFRDGLSKVIDGVVECLNASVWAKGKS
jgi:hypothetical protein